MSKKFFIIAAVMIVIAILGGSFYWLKQDNNEIVVSDAVTLSQPIIKWQEITITESKPKMAMHINSPRIIILNIATEVLLATPRLISLAFTSTKRFAGINNSEPERTFTVFDLINNKVMIEGNEIFRDDLAWSRATTIMKKTLLSDYKGDPSCDLSFAPKHNGLAASCIGIDNGRNRNLSLTRNIPISAIQEFLAPSVLSDITKP
ncbi:MAG: hypothetical protein A2Y49_02130 [Candidatus Zambryskibacteria bacterium RIFCSPLOWO2_12_39_8]|uniref:Uncharacterized protein n=1 Tax=Candidatus Zambryskibacteria bacterium RIFCSPLOWO2_12_39_8 TaxID=1802774 RepID=A0A1G2UWC1_9BACT|nr:MAG: hypothetical protein A2Y49_02130 [Candidatus Zambryskibacteria bacterium RIFCSPLOWO2_12_39_8]